MKKQCALFAVALAVLACDTSSKTDGAELPSKQPGEVVGDSKSEVADAETTKLDKVGLTAMVPAGSVVSDGLTGDGVMIMGSAPVNIGEVTAMDAKTMAAAKREAAGFKPTNLKEEKLADGWMLSFENTGSLGTNYWLQSVRTIGGKQFKCDTTVTNNEQLAAARAVCKSLHKS